MPEADRVTRLVEEWRRLLESVAKAPWVLREPNREEREESWDIYCSSETWPGFNDLSMMPEREGRLIVWMRNHAEEIIAALESQQRGSGRNDAKRTAFRRYSKS
jgi:hypothetical protein